MTKLTQQRQSNQSNPDESAVRSNSADSKPFVVLHPVRIDRLGNPMASLHSFILEHFERRQQTWQNEGRDLQFLSFAAFPTAAGANLPGGKFLRTSQSRWMDALLINTKSLLHWSQWDALHCAPNAALLPLVLAAKIAGRPIITTVHEAPDHTQHRDFLTRAILHYFASAATLRVSVSEFVRTNMQEAWGLGSVVIHNGIDTSAKSTFSPKKRSIALASEFLGVPLAGKKLVLYVGALIAGKGVLDVVETCRSRSDVVCAVIGKGPLKDQIRAAAVDHAHIIQKDFLAPKDIAILFATADVFFFPSRIDSFGLVYLEALASGTPVLSIQAAAAGEILAAQKFAAHGAKADRSKRSQETRSRDTFGVELPTGILCNTNAPQFSAALDRLLSRKKTRTSQEQLAAYVRKNFSKEVMAEQYIKLYDKALRLRDSRK